MRGFQEEVQHAQSEIATLRAAVEKARMKKSNLRLLPSASRQGGPVVQQQQQGVCRGGDLAWRDGFVDMSGGGITQEVAPHAVSLQQQRQSWAYSRGAVLLQQRQSRRFVCDSPASRREPASVERSSSPNWSAAVPDVIHVRVPGGQYHTVLRDESGRVSKWSGGGATRAFGDMLPPPLPVRTGAGVVTCGFAADRPSLPQPHAGVSQTGVGGIYDCGSNANYYQPKTRPPPNATTGWTCVCARCGRKEHVAAHCAAQKRFEGECYVCGQRGHTARHCRLRKASVVAKCAARSQQQLPLADATCTTALDELDIMERGCATGVVVPEFASSGDSNCPEGPDPEMVSSSKGEPLQNTSWQDEPAQQDEEMVLGVKSVICKASSWCFDEEEEYTHTSSSKNGSSDGASSSEWSDATWSGPPTHQFHLGKSLPGRAWRRGAILGVEHPFDRGKRCWRPQHGG